MTFNPVATTMCLLSVISLAGCISTEPAAPQLLSKLSQQQLKDELAAHIDEYQAVKPSIERLVELEGDLRVLITQISDMQKQPPNMTATSVASTASPANTILPIEEIDLVTMEQPSVMDNAHIDQPLQVPSLKAVKGNVPKTALKVSPTSAYKQCSPAPAQPNANQFAVHVSSFNRADLLSQGWDDAVQLQPSFCGKSAIVQRIAIKNKVFFSLRIGPYVDKPAAKLACTELRSKKQYCRVTDFTGETL